MPSARELVQQKLDHDYEFFARNALKIVGTDGMLRPLEPKTMQRRIYESAAAQRAAGRPVRLIVVKARQMGSSTACAGMVIQRTIRREHHRSVIIGHDNKTAGNLFDVAELMYKQLPAELQPVITAHRRTQEAKVLGFGRIGSVLTVDNARVQDAGRGFTYRTVLATEAAFYPYPEKLTSVLNAVPDDPDTMVIIESTAYGRNDFYDRVMAVERGESDYEVVFAPWFEEPRYRREFASPEDRERFRVGEGAWGAAEPDLIERHGCTLEQLLWRRRAIVERCESKLEVFAREYPATLEESFMVSGKHRFSVVLVQKALQAASEAPAPVEGMLLSTGSTTKKTRGGEVLIPTGAKFEEERGGQWRVWEHPVPAVDKDGKPQPPGQYVIAGDVSGGEEDTAGNRAYNAIQVIDHKTLKQVAEYRSRVDADLLAYELYLAGLYFNQGWIAVETTGGWGIPVVRKLWRAFGYPRLYFRTPVEVATDSEQDRLGWDTNRRTKPLLEAGAEELLRDGSHGIQSKLLAGEFTTYVRNPRNGQAGPERGKFSDLLMAWMIAQFVAREKPFRAERRGRRSYWEPRSKTIW